jgi:putative ABC transport system permease protein
MRIVEEVLARVAALPSVRSAAVGSDTPLGGNLTAGGLFVPEAATTVRAYRHSATSEYFATLGISVVRGRAFTREDGGDSSRAAMVNEAAARRFWPGQDPIGKRIRLGDEKGPEKEIVGVVGNARYQSLTQSLATMEPDVYFPYAARAISDIEMVIRTDGDPAALIPALRREMAARSIRGRRPSTSGF